MIFQVTEVLSRDKTRLSISGWFHGETAAFPRRVDPLPLVKEPPIEDGVTEEEVKKCKIPNLAMPGYLYSSILPYIESAENA